ncbi:MAG: hypothetical protein ACYCQI_06975 [Gammaproteobacteria bacterium]
MKKIILLTLLFGLHVTSFAAQCPSAEHFIQTSGQVSRLDSQAIAEGWVITWATGDEKMMTQDMQVDLYPNISQATCEYITGYNTAVIVENRNYIDASTIHKPPFDEVQSPSGSDFFCRTTADKTQKCHWG